MTHQSRRPVLTGCLVALAAGLAMSAAFPPAALWPVAFVALAPLIVVLRDAPPRWGALFGAVFGVALYGASLYWIALFGELAWTALTLLCAAHVAAFGLLVPVVLRPGRPIGNALACAAVWTALDWVRGVWPLGGFTWSSLGISQVDDRTLLPLAAVTAVWGVTFVVVLVNAAIAELVRGWGRGAGRFVLAAGALLAVLAPSLLPVPSAAGPDISIAVVQIDVRVPPSASAVEEDLIVARRSIELHRTLADQPRPDLAVWGEGALDPGALADPATVAAVRSSVAAVGVPTTIGAVVNDRDGTQHTSVLAFDAEGVPVDRYDKVHLVPFGEYVPFRRRLSWIHAIDQIPVDRVPGERIHTIAQPPLPAYGTPICFENAFPELPRRFVLDGASFLVVTVNNASYGFTAAAEQHLQMSRMRAVENARWVVNAGVSGISAFIAPDGSVRSRTELFVPGILRGRVTASDAVTPFVRFGDWFPLVCLVVIAVSFLRPRPRSHVRPDPGPLPAAARTLAILPTYDERDTIEQAIRGVLGTPGVDVLVVDDSSPDGTGAVVQAVAAGERRVRLRERPAKSGLASAYLEGFAVALAEGYDLAVEMDSDLSHDPTELPRLLAAAGTHDLVVGSRYVPGGSVTDWSRGRVALSRAGNAYARFMLALPIHDATSGYRVYRRGLLEELVRRPVRADGYGFQIELVMRADRLGYRVGEAPITFRERTYGVSKISQRIVAEALWMVTKWGLQLRLRGEPR